MPTHRPPQGSGEWRRVSYCFVGAGLTPRALAPPTAHSSQGVAGAAPPLPRRNTEKGRGRAPPLQPNPNPPATNKTVPITPPQKAGHAGPTLRRNSPSLRSGGAYPKGTGSTNCSFFAGCRWRCSALTPAIYGKREEQSPSPTTKPQPIRNQQNRSEYPTPKGGTYVSRQPRRCPPPTPDARHPASTTIRRGRQLPQGHWLHKPLVPRGVSLAPGGPYPGNNNHRCRLHDTRHRKPSVGADDLPQGHWLHQLLILRRVSLALSAPFALSYPGRGGQSRPPLQPK